MESNINWDIASLIIAIVGSALAVVGSVIAMAMAQRSESASDRRLFDAKLEANRQESNMLLRAISDETKDHHAEMRLIHARVSGIEEKNKGK